MSDAQQPNWRLLRLLGVANPSLSRVQLNADDIIPKIPADILQNTANINTTTPPIVQPAKITPVDPSILTNPSLTPTEQRIRDSTTNMNLPQYPERDQYKPGKLRNVLGVLGAITGGLSGHPEVGRNILDMPYNRAMQDYQGKIGALTPSVKAEESGRTAGLNLDRIQSATDLHNLTTQLNIAKLEEAKRQANEKIDIAEKAEERRRTEEERRQKETQAKIENNQAILKLKQDISKKGSNLEQRVELHKRLIDEYGPVEGQKQYEDIIGRAQSIDTAIAKAVGAERAKGQYESSAEGQQAIADKARATESGRTGEPLQGYDDNVVNHWAQLVAKGSSKITELQPQLRAAVTAKIANAGLDINMLTGQLKDTAAYGEQITSHSAVLRNEIEKLDREGKLSTVYNVWKKYLAGTIDTGDRDLAKFRDDISLMNSLLSKTHVGARGSNAILSRFDKMLNATILDKNTLLGGIDAYEEWGTSYAKMKSVKQLHDNETPLNETNQDKPKSYRDRFKIQENK